VIATPDATSPDGGPFDDLIQANQAYARSHRLAGFDGVAHAGVAMVTCMDSRIDPLRMIGLQAGDAKILRNPGGRVTDQSLIGLVLSVNLLGVDRILVVQHTRCAMASQTEQELRARLAETSGQDASDLRLDVISDQLASITTDVAKARAHPLIPTSVEIGGFLYDVDTGLLAPVA
jgi:carbonic anhydrase